MMNNLDNLENNLKILKKEHEILMNNLKKDNEVLYEKLKNYIEKNNNVLELKLEIMKKQLNNNISKIKFMNIFNLNNKQKSDEEYININSNINNINKYTDLLEKKIEILENKLNKEFLKNQKIEKRLNKIENNLL